MATHRILAIATNYGVEQDELLEPTRHFRDAGHEVTIAAPSTDPIRTLVGDKDPGQTMQPDSTLDAVNPGDYELLVIPGGTINADTLRLNDTALAHVRSFAGAGKPIAAICHGPWALVEADLVRGKTLTSYPSLATDIRNAGGSWVDQSVFNCEAQGFRLITSRTPKDLSDFLAEADKALAG